MKEKVRKQRGVQVFIPRESGGWGDAGRLTRRGGAKPERSRLAWKQERAIISPRRRLFIDKVLSIILIRTRSIKNSR